MSLGYKGKSLRVKWFAAILLMLMLSFFLVGCGETVTGSAVNTPAANATTVSNTVNGSATNGVTGKTSSQPAPGANPSAPNSNPANSFPANAAQIQLSKQTANVGEDLTMKGRGYPPNTRLKLLGGVQNPGLLYTSFLSDGQGMFTFVLNLNNLPDGSPYPFGPFTFAVVTEDGAVGGSATLNISKMSNKG